jgi:hypothetical protein
MTRVKARNFCAAQFKLGRKPSFVLKEIRRLGWPASRASVFQWAKDYKRGVALGQRRVGSGRPRVLTGQALRQLRSAVTVNGGRDFSARQWAKERNLNAMTVCNALKLVNGLPPQATLAK